MKNTKFIIILSISCMTGAFFRPAAAQDATSALFDLVHNEGCTAQSLTNNSWTISTTPVGTHGELLFSDTLEFVLKKAGRGVKKQSTMEVLRNGVPWESVTGWTGECVRDGDIGLWVVSGRVDVGGCPHEVAIGRLGHDDQLSGKVEIVFADHMATFDPECLHFDVEHPGHAHGTGNGD